MRIAIYGYGNIGRGVELAIVPTAQNFGQAALKDAVPFYEK